MKNFFTKAIENEPIYNDLAITSKDNMWTILMIGGFLGLFFIVAGYMLIGNSPKTIIEFFNIDENMRKVYSSIFITLGTIILTSLFVNFLHATNAFSKIMVGQFNKAITDKTFIQRYNDKEIDDLGKVIQKFHPHIKIDNSKLYTESIKLAREATKKMIQEAREHTVKDRRVERLSKQIHYIRESSHVRTIIRNGCEISTYELDIEIIKDGEFVFFYRFSPTNNEHVLPKFKTLSENVQNRFSESSFYADIIEYRRNNEIKNCTSCLTFSVIEETDSKIEIAMMISDCYKGDRIKLSFSLTLKDEMTKENIKNIRNDLISEKSILKPENYFDGQTQELANSIKKPPSSESLNPIGLRKVRIQQERYGKDGDVLRLSPSLKIGDIQIMSKKEEKNIFYKSIAWEIFYKEHSGKKMNFYLF